MEKNLKKASNELMEIEDTLFEEMQETYRNELERRYVHVLSNWASGQSKPRTTVQE